MAVADKKLNIVRNLLYNETYMVDSNAYQIAEKALMSLSLDALASLELIADQKRYDLEKRLKTHEDLQPNHSHSGAGQRLARPGPNP